MTEGNIIQVLIQGGAVGLALVLIGVVYKMSTNHSVHVEKASQKFAESLDKNTAAWLVNAKALQQLTDHLEK